MKQYRLIARQRLINPSTKRLYDDEGLKALDAFWASPVYEYEDSIHKTVIANELIEKYEKLPEAMSNCDYELIVCDKTDQS